MSNEQRAKHSIAHPERRDDSRDELIDGADEVLARREEVHQILDAQKRHQNQRRAHRFPARAAHNIRMYSLV